MAYSLNVAFYSIKGRMCRNVRPFYKAYKLTKKHIMKEKLFAALQTKFQGVSDAILNRVAEKLSKTVTDETQVTTAIEGVTTQTLLDSYADSRVGEATNTAISNYEKKHGIKEGKPVGVPPATPPANQIPDDAPEWAKAIIKQNQELATKVSSFEQNGQKQVLIGKLTEALKGKVPASYLKGRNIEIAEESQIEELAKSLETEFLEVKQEAINIGVVGDKPVDGNGNPSSASVENDIKNLGGKF